MPTDTASDRRGRRVLAEHVVAPGTGRAIELRRGQVLRLAQTAPGGQHADFDCFNLHDESEYLHAGRTRQRHGSELGLGSALWSAPPRDRPLAAIVAHARGTGDLRLQFGGLGTTPRPATAGNAYVELLALIDLLVVPSVCGIDVVTTGSLHLRPLALTVMEAGGADWALAPVPDGVPLGAPAAAPLPDVAPAHAAAA